MKLHKYYQNTCRKLILEKEGSQNKKISINCKAISGPFVKEHSYA